MPDDIPDPEFVGDTDDDEGYCALDHGPVEVIEEDAERLFLDACRRAAEAGL